MRVQPILAARFGALALLPAMAMAQAPARKITFDDDVKPIFRNRCFPCHSASETRSGLSLETYAGVMKGGGAGDAVKAGRPSNSVLYQSVMQETDGVPKMPFGRGRILDAELALIRDWIQGGALENQSSVSKVAERSLDFKMDTRWRPKGPPPMPGGLPPAAPPTQTNAVTALAASPWAPLSAVAGNERVYLYEQSATKPLAELPFPEGVPYVIRFSRDGGTLIVGGGRGAVSGKVALYDVRTGARKGVFGEERDVVLSADLSGDGELVAMGGPGKVVSVYSTRDGKRLYRLAKHTDWITALEFSPDGTRLATADRAGAAYIWEAKSGGILFNLAEHKESVNAMSWRGDSKMLATGGEDGKLVVWDADEGWPVVSQVATPRPGPAPPKSVSYGKNDTAVLSVQYAADGKLWTSGRDRLLRVWTAEGKRLNASQALAPLPAHIAISADGKLAIAGGDRGELLNVLTAAVLSGPAKK